MAPDTGLGRRLHDRLALLVEFLFHMAAEAVRSGLEHRIRDRWDAFPLFSGGQKTLIAVGQIMTGGTVCRRGLVQVTFGVPDRLVAVEAAGVFGGDMGFVHQFFGICILKVFDLVVAVQTALLFKPTRTLDQDGFENTPLEEGLNLCFTRALNEIKMATAASDPRLLEHLVGDVLRVRSFRGLDRLAGQLVAEFASGPALVELGVCKVAEVTGRLRDLKMLRVGYVLMASGAVDLHTLDLIFL